MTQLVIDFCVFFLYNIHIESERNKIMKDKLFRVRIALWRKAQPTRDTHIRAFDLAHAKRISNRLFGTLGVTVEPVEGRFERFKEFNR